MKVSVKIVTVPDVSVSGRLPVKLRVTCQRKVRYFPLNRYVLPEHWDKAAGRFKKGHPDWKLENEVLATYEQRALSTLRGFELDGVVFTFERFDSAVFGSTDKTQVTAAEFIKGIFRELDESGRVGNSEVYRNTANAVYAFKPRATLADIDGAWLAAFEKWMRTKRGTGQGGMSLIMRTLRAACNRAVKAGVMPKGFRPFEDYSLSHLKGDNVKKAVSLDKIKMIGEIDVPHRLDFSRDLFMLSFYLRGMNMADLAELRRENIKDGRIVYKRKKTGGLFSVPITQQVADILAKYEGLDAHYMLPIFLSGIHVTERQKMYRVKRVTKEVNAAIREVAAMAGIDTGNFTFYTARHSYASALERKGVPRVIISQALGHKSLSTTEGYLKGFDNLDLDRADELLL